MKIEYYKEILALADIGNFLAASDYLYMSQSTLSRHIKAVEDEYGVTLFDRTTHTMEITPEGEMLLLYAKQMVDLYENFQKQVLKGAEQKENPRELSFAYATYSMDTYSISEMLLEFRRRYPEIPVSRVESIKQGNWNITQYDFTFLCETEEEMQTNNFGRISIDRDEIVVAMPPNHPLAERKNIRFEELRKENFILTTPGSWLREWCMNACARNGFVPRELFIGLEGHNLIDMIVRGYGITLLKRKTAEHIYENQFAMVSLIPKAEIYINMVYLKRSLTAEARCFLDYMEKYMKRRNNSANL